jgi:hypothetical protein
MLIVVKQLSHKIHIIFLVEQVHKSATMLQQLAALCSFCENNMEGCSLLVLFVAGCNQRYSLPM